MNIWSKWITALVLAFALSPARAQLAPKTTCCFQSLPELLTDANQAWKLYYPKSKPGPFAGEELKLRKEADRLADLSDHQSYFLAWVAKRYENDPKRTDVTQSKLKKDKSLESLTREINIEVARFWNDYSRNANHLFDSLMKNGLRGRDLANAWLRDCRAEIITLLGRLEKPLDRLQKYMSQKGYNAAVDKIDRSHPYFVQLLETRGYLLDQQIKAFEVVDHANGMAADLVDACQKNPEACR